MFTLLNSRMTRTLAAAVMSLNLGLGVAAPAFATTTRTTDAGLQQPSQDTGELTPEALAAMLKSLNINFNTVTDNGSTDFQISIPAKGDNAAVQITLAISPNHKWVNVWYVAEQFNQQSMPNQQTLLAMLQANDKFCPTYIDIENNLVVVRVNLRNNNLAAAELVDQLKSFYATVQQVRTVCVATPVENQPSPNPFG